MTQRAITAPDEDVEVTWARTDRAGCTDQLAAEVFPGPPWSTRISVEAVVPKAAVGATYEDVEACAFGHGYRARREQAAAPGPLPAR